MDTYKEDVFIDNCYINKWKILEKFYIDFIVNPWDFSFMIVDKIAPLPNRYIYCEKGKNMDYVDIY